VLRPITPLSSVLGRAAAARGRHSAALCYAAGLLTLGAAAIHLSVAPDHLAESLPIGLFSILLSVGQTGLAIATVLTPSRKLFAGATAATLAVLAIWALSRTTGLPIGPTPWKPEPAGFADVTSGLLEAVSAVLFTVLAVRRPRPLPTRRRTMVLTLAPTAVFGLLIAFAGVESGLNGTPIEVDMSAVGPARASVDELREAPGSEPVRSFTLTAEVATVEHRTVWTYNGTVPGPELRVTEGDRMRITLVNHLPRATSIHWHGLSVPNAEDGVTGITQDAVLPGHTYTYEFVLKASGTYWYHAHQEASEQIAEGLYGALVVEPRQGPRFDRDHTIVIGNLGDHLTMNGTRRELRLDARPGELVRLRIVNAVIGDLPGLPERVVLAGAPYAVVALDGHDLNRPPEIGPQRLELGMGQRCDLASASPPLDRWCFSTRSSPAACGPAWAPAPCQRLWTPVP
jgi:hypothetical protein